ncbi:MAG TPA: glycosyltransferase family 39 protein, partial [Candidatus Elarobacter sp.]|nr:glycosyltransferase family 39 protein [Candidatus Elarobacter sp.]
MTAAARRDYLLLTSIAVAISVGALIFYYHQGAILLYGDAMAHIHIARRVFDSRTPGLFQLGTVWLPLPHLLDIPFIVNDRLWQTGLGASIPSMIAYIAGTLGVFRLVYESMLRGPASRMAAWIAALIYALNPNLLYMQATAMTESLYLACFIWLAVYFAEFVHQARDDAEQAGKSLRKCGFMVSAAMLVRYDGWFLAAVVGA